MALSYGRYAQRRVPTADEVNVHTMAPVDAVQPYDYSKHVKDYMGARLGERRGVIGEAVAQRVGESFGIAIGAGLGAGEGTPRRVASAASLSQQTIPRPPPSAAKQRGTASVHSPIANSPRPPTAARNSPRSAVRPQSSPIYRRPNATNSANTSAAAEWADEDRLLAALQQRRASAVSAASSLGPPPTALPTLDEGDVTIRMGDGSADRRRHSADRGGGTFAASSPSSSLNRPYSSASAAGRGGKVMVPTLATRPTPDEVAAAVAMLRDRANNSPVKGVPFVAGAVAHTNAPISGYGYGHGSGRLSQQHATRASDDYARSGSPLRVAEGYATEGGVGALMPSAPSWAGTTAEGPTAVPTHNNLAIRRQKAKAAMVYAQMRAGSPPLHAYASSTEAEALSPSRFAAVGEASAKEAMATAVTVRSDDAAFGGAGLGAGAGLSAPTDVTLSWMLRGDSANASRKGTRKGHSASASHGAEPLCTPRAPLLRHECSRADHTYLPTAAAVGRRRQQARRRAAEERQELERIAAATVRMQSDHEQRRALRQRRFLQGLALQQPFEMAHFRRVVEREWAGVEEARAAATADDIPPQILAQSGAAEGGALDRMSREALVSNAVRSARHTRFEREARPAQSQFSPRRELL